MLVEIILQNNIPTIITFIIAILIRKKNPIAFKYAAIGLSLLILIQTAQSFYSRNFWDFGSNTFETLVLGLSAMTLWKISSAAAFVLMLYGCVASSRELNQ